MLANKVAIITGAASGIGAGTAEVFAEQGARLVLVDRDAAGLKRVADALPLVSERVAGGEPFSAAVAAVAADAGLSRKALYQAALAARKDADG